ncbi:hypothetical protein, partial [Escherichia coli]
QAYARQRNSLIWRDFCRSDKAFTPHPTSTPDATLAASYQAYARQRNSLIWRDFCRSDKAFTPHPASMSDAMLTCLIRPTSDSAIA